MRMRVADYIAQFLVDHDINHCFMVVGGGAMQLDDAFGHQEGLTCVFNHHEQACAMAAEGYARIRNTPAAVCVTSGPGGTNAITGVMSAYLDSIPMLVFSGQVRFELMTRSTGLTGLRNLGDQEFDICTAVSSLTKYCEVVKEASMIRSCLERAYHLATTGRPGPCWLDVPLDVQGTIIEVDDLPGYCPDKDDSALPARVSPTVAETVLDKIWSARRPVLYAGYGIRLSDGYEVFRRVVDKLGIPVVFSWDSVDMLPDDHPLNAGRPGIVGDRAGNFAVQNADVILSIGTRLGIRQVGFDAAEWARNAYVIMNDICADETRKPTIHVDMPLVADARDLLEQLEAALEAQPRHNTNLRTWIETCQHWRATYPVVRPEFFDIDKPANPYVFIKRLSEHLGNGRITVTGSGFTSVAGGQAATMREGSRYLINCATCSLGWDLPAAIGACIAEHGDNALYGHAIQNGNQLADTILFTGDGGIQFNLQELQVVVHHQMPLKIFIINNDGYHSIRMTQTNLFDKKFIGIGPQSGDLSFPDMERIAWAYEIPFCRCSANSEIDEAIEATLALSGPAICEIMVGHSQVFEPKAATKRLPDGTLISPPLEDMAPFLPPEELARIMSVSAETAGDAQAATQVAEHPVTADVHNAINKHGYCTREHPSTAETQPALSSHLSSQPNMPEATPGQADAR